VSAWHVVKIEPRFSKRGFFLSPPWKLSRMQADLDQWNDFYKNERTHQGKMCCGRIPHETMMEGKEIWREKFIN